MFQFAYPSVLYAFAAVPVLIALFVYARHSSLKRLRKFGELALLDAWMPDRPRHKHTVKFCLALAALIIMIIGTAGPRYGTQLQEVKRSGSEIIIALDVSNSMMAQDIEPNRLERSKQAVSRLVDRLADDKLGLIIFAGEAYTQLPITTDYISAKMFLSSINPDLVDVQGTAIGSAIELAIKSFSPETSAGKTIVVITDGENHEDDPVAAARKAAERGITVHAIGVGSLQGTPIPKGTSGTDYWKDRNGEVVVSKLDEKTLQEMTAAGHGIYVRATTANLGLNAIFDEIQKAGKSEYSAKTYAAYAHVFQWVFALAFMLLFMDLWISEKRSTFTLSSWSIRHAGLMFWGMVLVGLLTPDPASAQTEVKEIRKGNRMYDGRPADAEIQYRKALEINSQSEPATYNLGNALFRQEKYEAAASSYQAAAGMTDEPMAKSRAKYNEGNALLMDQKIRESIEAYKDTICRTPSICCRTSRINRTSRISSRIRTVRMISNSKTRISRIKIRIRISSLRKETSLSLPEARSRRSLPTTHNVFWTPCNKTSRTCRDN